MRTRILIMIISLLLSLLPVTTVQAFFFLFFFRQQASGRTITITRHPAAPVGSRSCRLCLTSRV